jgi:Co/Zn/Cd efflux system component
MNFDASAFKSAATLFALCPRIAYTARDRFFAPAGPVASPWEIQCHRKPGI